MIGVIVMIKTQSLNSCLYLELIMDSQVNLFRYLNQFGVSSISDSSDYPNQTIKAKKGRNKIKQKIYNKFYRQKNKETIRKYNEKYYQSHSPNYTKNICCIDCNKLISNHSKRCYFCSGKSLSNLVVGKKRNPLSQITKQKISNSERLARDIISCCFKRSKVNSKNGKIK